MLFVLLALALAASFYFGRKFGHHETDEILAEADETVADLYAALERRGYVILCPMHCDKCVRNAREYLKGADENQ